MPHKAYIAERDTLRQEIERQVSEFLSRGGKIAVLPPGESSFVEGPCNCETRSAEQARRAHVVRFVAGGRIIGATGSVGDD